MNSDNLIRRIRAALGMSQSDFARLIGRSHQSVGNYERGGPIPPEVVQSLHEIVANHALADLALELKGDWQVQRIFHPGETIISQARPTSADQEWHDLLDEVLSGDSDDGRQLVKSALIAASKLGRPKPLKVGVPRKASSR